MTVMALNVEDVGGYAEVASGAGLGLSAMLTVQHDLHRMDKSS